MTPSGIAGWSPRSRSSVRRTRTGPNIAEPLWPSVPPCFNSRSQSPSSIWSRLRRFNLYVDLTARPDLPPDQPIGTSLDSTLSSRAGGVRRRPAAGLRGSARAGLGRLPGVGLTPAVRSSGRMTALPLPPAVAALAGCTPTLPGRAALELVERRSSEETLRASVRIPVGG